MKAARVLICDDESIVRSLLKRRLASENADWTFEEAGSLAEIVAKATSFHPDIIVLDLNYPDAGPAEILAEVPRLRRSDQHPSILIVSGLPEAAELARSINAGFTDKNTIAEGLNALWKAATERELMVHAADAIVPQGVVAVPVSERPYIPAG